MEWEIWISWWIVLYIRYWRLFWILKTIYKNNGEKIVNPSVRIYIDKIENRIPFKIKTGNYLELITPETMELVGSTKVKITKNENGENVPNLQINEVV